MADEITPCTDCPDDEVGAELYAAATTTAVATEEPDAEPDPRGTKVTKWSGLLAPIGKPTGDGRRFAAQALTNRDLPLPLKWQRTDSEGHKNSVVVGTLDHVDYRDDGVYGVGVLFDPDPEQMPKLAEDCAEARFLLDQKAIGPSVDLDAMEFHAMPGQEGQLSDGKRPEIEVDKGRISAATLVPIPAFAEARPFELSEMDADEYANERDAAAALTASARTEGWLALNMAAPEREWSALDAVGRLMSWAGDDLERYAQAFLWARPGAESLSDFRFPLADVVDGQLAIIPGAIEAAYAYLDQADIASSDRQAMRDVLDQMADQIEWTEAAEAYRVVAGLTDEVFATVADLAEQLVHDEDGSDTYGPRFDKIVAETGSPALAAYIGRKKYGKRGMARLRAGAPAKDVKPLRASLVAAATEEVIVRPSADVFRVPEPDKLTPLHIAPDGSITGHIASWKSCHTGFQNQCVRAPRSRSSYAYFHTGAVLTAEGDEIPVGRLSVGGGHADTRYGMQAAVAHYDNASTAVAELRAIDGKHGIWVSGRMLPEYAGTDMEATLRRHPPSGDWRYVGGNLEMMHVLAVNTPGFPVPRVSMTASAYGDGRMDVVSLVAAGVVMTEEQTIETAGGISEDMIQRAARAAVAEYAAQQRLERGRAIAASFSSAAADAATLARRQEALAAAALLTDADADFAFRFRHGWIPIGGAGDDAKGHAAAKAAAGKHVTIHTTRGQQLHGHITGYDPASKSLIREGFGSGTTGGKVPLSNIDKIQVGTKPPSYKPFRGGADSLPEGREPEGVNNPFPGKPKNNAEHRAQRAEQQRASAREEMHRDAAVTHLSPHRGGQSSHDMSDEAMQGSMQRMPSEDLRKVIKNHKGNPEGSHSERVVKHAQAELNKRPK